MNEGKHAAALANERDAPPPHVFGETAIRGVEGSGPVELAIAEHEGLHTERTHDSVLMDAQGVDDFTGAGNRGVQRVVFRRRCAVAGIVEEGDALGDEAPSTGGLCGFDQSERALGTEPVRRGQVSGDVAWVDPRGDMGQLVNHELGPGCLNGPKKVVLAEHIAHRRLGSPRANPVRAIRRMSHRGHLVPALHEARQQAAPDSAGGTCEEDSHT